MLTQIINQLKKRDLTGWQIRQTQRKSFQSFLAGEKKECTRLVETESYLISVYVKRPAMVSMGSVHGNGYHQPKGGEKPTPVLGMSNFKIGPGDGPFAISELDQKLDEALFACELVSNQTFTLATQPKKLPRVAIHDGSLDEKTTDQLEQRLRESLEREKGVRLSSAEFFVDLSHVRLVNHRGLDVEQEESSIHTEFILLSKSGTRENEYINRYTRRYLEDFDIEGEIGQSAQFARDATVAALPKTGQFPVLLTDEPLDQLFNPLIARASARLKYNKMMSMNVGESVVEEGKVKGDSITLWSNGLLKGAGGSSKFDGYGTPSKRLCLVENNKLKNFLADKRYSDYLDIPLTGELGNIEVAPGSMPYKSMEDIKTHGAKTMYVLKAFSAFEPNAITGAFSAEIRAGYEISSTGIKPVKGGSVSGVLQKNLLDCFLSKEQVQRERCLVPKGVLFSALTIAGA